MALARGLTAFGGGVTTFLLVAVGLIELLAFEFSAIVALPVAAIVGAVVAVGLWLSLAEQSDAIRRLVAAYAAFGIAVVLALAAQYVNLANSRQLTVDAVAGGALAVALVTYGLLWWQDRQRTDASVSR